MTKPKEEVNRATSETYRQKCIEQGLCVSCGSEPARQGKRLGEICAEKRSQEGKTRRAVKARMIARMRNAQKGRAA